MAVNYLGELPDVKAPLNARWLEARSAADPFSPIS
jgi:hypothetical protein